MTRSCIPTSWHAPARRGRREAQSLVAALIVLAFVTSLFGAMSVALWAEAGLATGHHERLEAFYAARAGAEAAMRELLADDPAVDALTDGWSDNPEAFEGVGLGRAVFHVRYRRFEDGAFVFGAVDEERKVNINTASASMLARLSQAFDRDSAYAVLNHRMRRPFRSPAELEELGILRRGTLREPLPGAHGRLGDLLTVFGDGRVNVNTAVPHVLACLPGVTLEKAEVFALWRKETGFAVADLGEAARLLGVGAEHGEGFRRHAKVSSDHFTIFASGRLPDAPGAAADIRQVVNREPGGLTVLEFEQLR